MKLLPVDDTWHLVTYPCGHRHRHRMEYGEHRVICVAPRCHHQATLTITPAACPSNQGWARVEVNPIT